MIFAPVLRAIKSGAKVVNANKAAIMTTTSVIFTIKAVVDTYRLTNDIIDKQRELDERGAKTSERIFETAKVAAPIILDVAVATGCAVGAHVVNTKVINGLNASLVAADRLIETQMETIEEKCGEEVATDIRNEVTKKQAREAIKELPAEEVTYYKDPKQLWFCPYSNNFFWASEVQMQNWLLEFQKKGQGWSDGVDFDDWLYLLPIDPRKKKTLATKDLCYSEEDCTNGISIVPYLSDVTDEGIPYRIARLDPEPRRKFGNFR
jgi:NAD-dependent DNA ligase